MDNMDLREQFPNLDQLLSVYLNQDFDIYGPNLEDAVNVFVDDSTAEEIAETRLEIAKFLDIKANDLDAELERLCWDYSHEPDMNAHDYLLWLDGLLAKGPAKKLL